MNKIFLTLIAFTLVGAGCTSLTNKENDNWYLSFDYPTRDWVMVPNYLAESMPIDLDGVNFDDSEVFLQSSSSNMIFSGAVIDEKYQDDITDVQFDNMTQIDVLRLSARRHLSDDVEDLGNGFYRLSVCDESTDLCGLNGKSKYEYYYVADSGNKYLFSVKQNGQDLLIAEKVILSASETKINE